MSTLNTQKEKGTCPKPQSGLHIETNCSVRSGHALARSPSGRGESRNSLRSPSPSRIKTPSAKSRQSRSGSIFVDGKNGVVHELQQLLDSERRRVTMLEAELRLAIGAAHQAEQAHQAELATMDADRKRLLAERRQLMAKLTTVERVEDTVKELYVQMKDRMSEDSTPTPEQLAAEKEALAEENVLVVLGALHAQLRALWAFKVEAEADMVANRTARAQTAEGQLEHLRSSLRSLECELRQARQETAATALRADMAEDALFAMQAEATAMATAMSSQHAELLSALRAETNEVHAARRAAAAALEEGRRRDTLVLANRQLESARHFDRVSQDRELRRLQAAHEVQLSAMHKELQRISELMATNALQAQQLETAMRTVKSIKTSTQPGRVRDLEAKVKLLESKLSTSERQRLAALEAALTAGGTKAGPSNQDASKGGAAWSSSPRGADTDQGHGHAAARPAGLSASTSMAARSALLMSAARNAAAINERDRIAEKPDDPIYQVISPVGTMHKATQHALKGVRRELAEAGYSTVEGGLSTGLGSGPYRCLKDQSTQQLGDITQPQGKKCLGAAGTNLAPVPVKGSTAGT